MIMNDVVEDAAASVTIARLQDARAGDMVWAECPDSGHLVSGEAKLQWGALFLNNIMIRSPLGRANPALNFVKAKRPMAVAHMLPKVPGSAILLPGYIDGIEWVAFDNDLTAVLSSADEWFVPVLNLMLTPSDILNWTPGQITPIAHL